MVRISAACSMARSEAQWLTLSPAHSTATRDRASAQSPAIVQSSSVQFSVHRESAVRSNVPPIRAPRYRSTPSTQQYSSSIVPCGEHSYREREAAVRSFCIAQKIIASSPIKSPVWNQLDQSYAPRITSLHRMEGMPALQRTVLEMVLHRERNLHRKETTL